MADPVVLVGFDRDNMSVGAIGLYESAASAREAVLGGTVPTGYFYSVMTPAMGTTLSRREMPLPDPPK